MSLPRNSAIAALLRQFDTAWQLLDYHTQTLTTDICLWRPAGCTLHLVQDENGRLTGRFPESEAYDIGPPSPGWICWHMLFWWKMTLNHNFGDGKLVPEAIFWPGDADGFRAALLSLRADWLRAVEGLRAEQLAGTDLSKWPLTDCPFTDIVGWVNVELTKNAAELGYARFLYAVRPR
ncbi:MAG: DinB family protein [Balneolales bacterium]|nr:DinB family protein [Balneolales bacterium]